MYDSPQSVWASSRGAEWRGLKMMKPEKRRRQNKQERMNEKKR